MPLISQVHLNQMPDWLVKFYTGEQGVRLAERYPELVAERQRLEGERKRAQEYEAQGIRAPEQQAERKEREEKVEHEARTSSVQDLERRFREEIARGFVPGNYGDNPNPYRGQITDQQLKNYIAAHYSSAGIPIDPSQPIRFDFDNGRNRIFNVQPSGLPVGLNLQNQGWGAITPLSAQEVKNRTEALNIPPFQEERKRALDVPAAPAAPMPAIAPAAATPQAERKSAVEALLTGRYGPQMRNAPGNIDVFGYTPGPRSFAQNANPYHQATPRTLEPELAQAIAQEYGLNATQNGPQDRPFSIRITPQGGFTVLNREGREIQPLAGTQPIPTQQFNQAQQQRAQYTPPDLRNRYADLERQLGIAPGAPLPDTVRVPGLMSYLERELHRPEERFQGRRQEAMHPDIGMSEDMMRQSIGSYEPSFRQARQALTQAQRPTHELIGQYMNPYQQAVVNRIREEGQRTFRESIMPELANRFVKMGQHGSTRHADLAARAARDLQNEIMGSQSKALFTGYNNAAKMADQDLIRQLQAAKQHEGLGVSGQAAKNLDVEALRQQGAARTAHGQQGRNIAYDDFLRQQFAPWQRIQNASNIASGTPIPPQQAVFHHTPGEPALSTAGNMGNMAMQLLAARMMGGQR